MVLQNKRRKFHHVNDITDIREFQMSNQKSQKSNRFLTIIPRARTGSEAIAHEAEQRP